MLNDMYRKLGVRVPDIMLPKHGIDMGKWATVACDQYTSQPDYWEEVEKIVGDSPSTLRITLPEIFLESSDKKERIEKIHATMNEYIDSGVLEKHAGAIYTERNVGGVTRAGLIIALDLEQYDFKPGSQTLVRATEGTVVERIPPRVEIRNGAKLESPHIMILIDDRERSVIEPLSEVKANAPLYDFELMQKGGRASGWLIDENRLEKSLEAIVKLADKKEFMDKYEAGEDKGVLLFAVGDGNHSLATAKTVWEMNKEKLGEDHPLRYALVEIVNLHSPAIVFEPIHRVLFGLKKDVVSEAKSFFGNNLDITKVSSFEAMEAVVKTNDGMQKCGVIDKDGYYIWQFANPTNQLSVGTLQSFLDVFIKEGAEKIDYVHGSEEVHTMGKAEGNFGFYLEGMNKNDLFKTVIFDGVLPRKTFSMGEAHEKRFYIECREIL